MLEQKTINIDGNEITIQQLGTTLALRHSVILGQLFSGMSKGIESKGKKSIQDWNIDFGEIIQGLMSEMDPDKSPLWIKELVQQSVVTPQFNDTWFDATFSGNLENLLLLIIEILNHNYGGLFEYARKKIEAALISDTSLQEKEGAE